LVKSCSGHEGEYWRLFDRISFWEFDVEVDGVFRRLGHDDAVTLGKVKNLQDKSLAKVDLNYQMFFITVRILFKVTRFA
jgi:hypothetical protein